MKKKQEETKTANKPVTRLKNGPVNCSVFINKTKDGIEFPSAVISRTYKSGETFKETNSFGAKHLPDLARLVVSLQTWVDANYPNAAK